MSKKEKYKDLPEDIKALLEKSRKQKLTTNEYRYLGSQMVKYKFGKIKDGIKNLFS